MKNDSKHVLLVDDSKSTNFFNKVMIKKTGFATKISVAENGAEALRYFDYDRGDSDKPDLIFLDINMPVMNGLEFLDHYNRLNYEKKVDVVMMIGTPLLEVDEQKLEQYDFIIERSEKMLSKTFLRILEEKRANTTYAENIVS